MRKAAICIDFKDLKGCDIQTICAIPEEFSKVMTLARNLQFYAFGRYPQDLVVFFIALGPEIASMARQKDHFSC